MNSLPDRLPGCTRGEGEEDYPEERVEDFLDHFCAPLVGILSYRERADLRREVRSHLEWLIAEHGEQGASPEEAVEAALREFGDPWQAGEALLREKREATSGKVPLRQTQTGTVHGLAWFGPPTVLCLLLLEWLALEPHQEALLPPLPLLFFLALLAPVAAGCLTGITAPLKAAPGAGAAVGMLSLASLAVGLLLLPRPDGLLFALFQLIVWLPLGWVSAACTVVALRQRRRYRFLHLAHRQELARTVHGGNR